MRIFVIISLAIAAALAAPAEEKSTRIVGGVNAIPGEFPYIVSLQLVILGFSTHVCGGSILNNIWVLSAAHCFTEIPNLGRLDVLVGKHNLALDEASQVRVQVDRPRSIIHPGWVEGPQVGPDDLVLVRLMVPLTFNDRVRPIRLPQANLVPIGPATLSGWGSNGGTGAVNILQKAILSTISLEVCRNAINGLNLDGSLVDDTNFCTGPLTGGLSACSGDSGGPLIQGAAPNEILIGVVSWGITPCGSPGAPSGVFKRVSAFNAWISANTGITA